MQVSGQLQCEPMSSGADRCRTVGPHPGPTILVRDRPTVARGTAGLVGGPIAGPPGWNCHTAPEMEAAVPSVALRYLFGWLSHAAVAAIVRR
jgi:hypothetical protein